MSPENTAAHVRAEAARAEEALRAAHALVGLGLFSDAVSRAYYATMHFARTLLLTEGVDPRTHGGIGTLLGMHFVVTGRLAPARAKELARLEGFRAEADYNRFFVFTAEGAAEELAAADRFCAAARELLAGSRA